MNKNRISRRNLLAAVPVLGLTACNNPSPTSTPATSSAATSAASSAASSASSSAVGNAAKMLTLAQQNVASIKETKYTPDVQINAEQGIFNAECSSYVQYLVTAINPVAINEVPISTKRNRPVAKGYAEFFKALADGTKTSDNWEAVKTADDLRAGDIVAWISPEANAEADSDGEGNKATGHIMVVAEQPYQSEKFKEALDYRLIDCTHVHHAHDSRGAGQTGLGMGNAAIHRASNTFADGYYWKADEEPMKNTVVAAARLK